MKTFVTLLVLVAAASAVNLRSGVEVESALCREARNHVNFLNARIGEHCGRDSASRQCRVLRSALSLLQDGARFDDLDSTSLSDKREANFDAIENHEQAIEDRKSSHENRLKGDADVDSINARRENIVKRINGHMEAVQKIFAEMKKEHVEKCKGTTELQAEKAAEAKKHEKEAFEKTSKTAQAALDLKNELTEELEKLERHQEYKNEYNTLVDSFKERYCYDLDIYHRYHAFYNSAKELHDQDAAAKEALDNAVAKAKEYDDEVEKIKKEAEADSPSEHIQALERVANAYLKGENTLGVDAGQGATKVNKEEHTLGGKRKQREILREWLDMIHKSVKSTEEGVDLPNDLSKIENKYESAEHLGDNDDNGAKKYKIKQMKAASGETLPDNGALDEKWKALLTGLESKGFKKGPKVKLCPGERSVDVAETTADETTEGGGENSENALSSVADDLQNDGSDE